MLPKISTHFLEKSKFCDETARTAYDTEWTMAEKEKIGLFLFLGFALCKKISAQKTKIGCFKQKRVMWRQKGMMRVGVKNKQKCPKMSSFSANLFVEGNFRLFNLCTYGSLNACQYFCKLNFSLFLACLKIKERLLTTMYFMVKNQ